MANSSHSETISFLRTANRNWLYISTDKDWSICLRNRNWYWLKCVFFVAQTKCVFFIAQTSKVEVENTLTSKTSLIEELECKNTDLLSELSTTKHQHSHQIQCLQTDLEQQKAQIDQKQKRYQVVTFVRSIICIKWINNYLCSPVFVMYQSS